MPVDTPHPEYLDSAAEWVKMRHIIQGAKAIREAGPLYLPQLTGQESKDYVAYKIRAKFFNGTARTAAALHGFIFRRKPDIKAQAGLEIFLRDADMQGEEFQAYIETMIQEVIEVGRCGSLVSWSQEENRPYVAQYCAEDIINWRMGRINGRSCLVMLVLREWATDYIEGAGVKPEDEYAESKFEQFRVLQLQSDGNGDYYLEIKVWRRKSESKPAGGAGLAATGTGPSPMAKSISSKDEFLLVETIIPARRGNSLDRIPFVFHGPRNLRCCIDKAPLSDLAEVNLCHWRNSADLQNGRHISGLPTVWAAGFSDGKDKTPLALGSNVAWESKKSDAKCGFLEVTSGFNSLEKAIVEDKEDMAALGSRMLEKAPRDAEAFETVQMRQSGENATLASIASAGSKGLTMILRWAAWWMGNADDPETIDGFTVELNQDFAGSALDAQTITALMGAYTVGGFGYPTLFDNLQRAGIIDPDKTLEEEQTDVAARPSVLPPGATQTGGFGGQGGGGGGA